MGRSSFHSPKASALTNYLDNAIGSNQVPALGDLVQIDLQVKYEKFRRRPDDWQLPLYDM